MKSINYYKLLVIPLFILLAILASFCTTRESQVDSQEVAEEKNKEKFTTREAETDARFVTDAVAAGLAEIRLADVALEKSRDEELKQLALTLKNEHAIMLANLKNYAAEKVITLPLTESSEVRKKVESLQTESTEFNKKWCNEVRSLHKESIDALEKGRKNVSDPVLISWIDSSLPTLRRHLDSVSACHNRLK